MSRLGQFTRRNWFAPSGRHRSPATVMEQMILAGMNVARLNFSHGDFSGHQDVIQNLREAERATGRRIAIMADLPGPKMRIGRLKQEPIELKTGSTFVLTAATSSATRRVFQRPSRAFLRPSSPVMRSFSTTVLFSSRSTAS